MAAFLPLFKVSYVDNVFITNLLYGSEYTFMAANTISRNMVGENEHGRLKTNLFVSQQL